MSENLTSIGYAVFYGFMSILMVLGNKFVLTTYEFGFTGTLLVRPLIFATTHFFLQHFFFPYIPPTLLNTFFFFKLIQSISSLLLILLARLILPGKAKTLRFDFFAGFSSKSKIMTLVLLCCVYLVNVYVGT